MKQRQEDVIRILDAYKINYELIDISISLKKLQQMRRKVSSPKALPPQIFNGQEYCGVSVNVNFYFIFILYLKVTYCTWGNNTCMKCDGQVSPFRI